MPNHSLISHDAFASIDRSAAAGHAQAQGQAQAQAGGADQQPQGQQQQQQQQQQQNDRGFFPRPDEPEFGQWVAGGIMN